MKPVRCTHCGYEWETLSRLQQVTCPSCGRKTPNKEREVET